MMRGGVHTHKYVYKNGTQVAGDILIWIKARGGVIKLNGKYYVCIHYEPVAVHSINIFNNPTQYIKVLSIVQKPSDEELEKGYNDYYDVSTLDAQVQTKEQYYEDINITTTITLDADPPSKKGGKRRKSRRSKRRTRRTKRKH